MVASYRRHVGSLARSLGGASHGATFLALGGDWAFIAVATGIGYRYPSPLVYSLCCLVIAARQHALAVLMHEGAHCHLARNPRWNDVVANVFAAWPLGLSVERYRAHHWKHHQYTNTEQDPDWGRKVTLPQWQFPKSSARFWGDFLPYLKGLGFREIYFAVRVIGVDRKALPRALVFYAVIAAGLTLVGGWGVWAKFWLVPYLTVLPILMKVRSIVEHLGLPNRDELSGSRNIVGSPVEAFFLGPHSNSLHLIHHLFPQVPWHRLAQLRRALLEDDGFRSGARENQGYFLPTGTSAYSDLVGRPKADEADRIAA